MTGFFQIGGVAAALTVIGLSFALTPPGAWDPATVVSTLVLALAAGIGVAAPQILLGYGRSQTGTLSSVGLNGFVITGFFFLALVSLIQAISGVDRGYVWATSIAAIGWFAVGLAISRGAINYVDSEFPGESKVSFTSNAQDELSSLKSKSDGQFAADIERLAEAIRFSASDVKGAATEENDRILLVIKNDLNQAVLTNDMPAFGDSVLRIHQLLIAREGKLKEARGRE